MNAQVKEKGKSEHEHLSNASGWSGGMGQRGGGIGRKMESGT